jgi:oligopeptide/dipeptide ABC transporter ATP-binding protein
MPEAPARDQANGAPLLAVENLVKRFPVRGGIFGRAIAQVHAVDGVSFTLRDRETLGIVGESGCGKSTLARMIVRLTDPTGGTIRLRGTDISTLSAGAMRRYRRDIQFVFQDPYASLNPRLRAGAIVGEAIENFEIATGADVSRRVAALFARVGLRPAQMHNYPHEFSGGQRQRLGIARALALNPNIIVADEPVSALDVSVQAQVINLMIDLQQEFGIAYLFIAHDLAVVQHISHRVAVMYLGRIVEIAPRDALFSAPLHPYTEALLDSVPIPDPALRRERDVLPGEVPSPIRPPPGCHFHTRCPLAQARCRIEAPVMVQTAPDHFVACHVRAPAPPAPPLANEDSP